jgi:hypothetical protein
MAGGCTLLRQVAAGCTLLRQVPDGNTLPDMMAALYQGRWLVALTAEAGGW